MTLQIKTRHSLELLIHEIMKILGSLKISIIKDKNGENVSQLENAELILAHCNVANNQDQHKSRALCTFVPNK